MDDKNCSGIKNLPCLYLSDAGHAKAPKAVRACAAEAAHLAPPVEDGEWQVWRDDVTEAASGQGSTGQGGAGQVTAGQA